MAAAPKQATGSHAVNASHVAGARSATRAARVPSQQQDEEGREEGSK